jgi:phage I-like protein
MSDNQEQVLNSNEPLSSQQKKKSVHIEMFRAGPQISSTGQKLMFTEEDLDQVVGTYVPGDHEAPLIIGHDQSDGTPALGWVKNLWRKGKALWGNVELTPKAEKLIRDGVFKKVSSSFYLPEAETNPHPGKLALRHLGLVSIPAVKGLTAFSEGEINEEKILNLSPQKKGRPLFRLKKP